MEYRDEQRDKVIEGIIDEIQQRNGSNDIFIRVETENYLDASFIEFSVFSRKIYEYDKETILNEQVIL